MANKKRKRYVQSAILLSLITALANSAPFVQVIHADDRVSAHAVCPVMALSQQKGTMPLILSSPHGASRSKKIPNYEERQGKSVPARKFLKLSDSYTDEVTWRMARHIERLTGQKPFVVAAEIHRSQIDFNRPTKWSYEHPGLNPCYEDYHHTLSAFIENIHQQWGNGLLLDVHGQSKRPKALIRGTQNGLTVTKLRERLEMQSPQSPVLKKVSESAVDLFELLAQQGYLTLPENGKPETLYKGGYIVRTYGSHTQEGIDAIQIEIGRDLRNSAPKRIVLANDLARSVVQFMRTIELLKP